MRWFQFGTFSPIFRVHGTRKTDQNEFWSYGPDAQKILVSFDRLRYRMLPYIYSLAWKTTSEGYTPMRPLVMDFRNDVQAQNIGDQFMYGPAFLVNPVTEPGRHEPASVSAESDLVRFLDGNNGRGRKNASTRRSPRSIAALRPCRIDSPIGARSMEWATQKPADPIEIAGLSAAPTATSLCTKTRTTTTTTRKARTRPSRCIGTMPNAC